MAETFFPKDLAGVKALFKRLTSIQRSTLAILVVTGFLGLLYLVYSLLFLGQVYPRVMIGNEKFAGLTHEQVQTKVAALSQSLESQPVELTYQDKSNKILPKEADVHINVEATTDAIFKIGRSGNTWKSFLQQLSAPFYSRRLSAVITYDKQSVSAFVDIAAQTADQPAVNATAAFINDQLTFTKEKPGKVIDRELVNGQIVANWLEFHGGKITLEQKEDLPNVVLGDETAVRSQVEALSNQQLTLNYFSTKKSLNKKEIHQLIGFVGDGGSGPNNEQKLVARFTQDQVKSFLDGLASQANQPAQEPKLVVKNGVLSIAQGAKEGKVINVAQSADKVLTAIDSDEDNPTVDLVIDTQQPVITEANLSTLGIKERIGYGETSFVGSPTNRRLNIINGVSILSSSLIKPGEEFSTVKTLGAVDNTTGFLPELVIKENKTTPEFGGGLCQVSTTLFRAVMNAGLKVTERQNHSYRVSYYEPPVGLDATIYLPKPDFKFLNDTPGSILVQGQVVGNKVIFELWGSSDGRTSVVSQPQIISTTPVGDPIYADTDTLFKGETKQIEKAHDGAVTIATYTVTRNGQVINKQTFKSVYKAWPARFLVGTKEPPAPPA